MNHKQHIFNHMMTGASISPMEALKLFNCFSLAQRISELKRNDGVPVQSELVITHDGKRYSVYWLDKNYIADVRVGKIKRFGG